MNGGTCQLQDDGNFICRCTDGFTGLRCESGKDILIVCKNMCLCTSVLLRSNKHRVYVYVLVFLYLFSGKQNFG